MGMGQEYLMNDISASSEASEQKRNENRKYKVSAELRYNYVRHSGDKRWGMTAAFARVYSWKPASMTTGTHSLCWKQTNTS